MEKLKELVEKFYNYTINISITEAELTEHYYDRLSESTKEYLKQNGDLDNEIDRMIRADILWDFLYTPINIIDQLETDICEYGKDSYEFREIKVMYKEIKEVFPKFIMEKLEEE